MTNRANFKKSLKLSSHRDWAREQMVEPASRAAIACLTRNFPLPFPTSLLQPIGSFPAPSVDDVLGFLRNGMRFTNDDDVALQVRNPSTGSASRPGKPGGRFARLLGEDPTCVYVPVLTRPWMLDACHAETSCHLGVARTLWTLEHYCW